jgi:hypothetical protein
MSSGFFEFFTGTGFRIASGAFLGFFEAIAFALEIQEFGFMHEPIDEGDDATGIREDLGPFAEGLVGRDYVELESFFGGLTSKTSEVLVF